MHTRHARSSNLLRAYLTPVIMTVSYIVTRHRKLVVYSTGITVSSISYRVWMSKNCVVSKNNAKSNDDQWLPSKDIYHGTLTMLQLIFKRGNTFQNRIIWNFEERFISEKWFLVFLWWWQAAWLQVTRCTLTLYRWYHIRLYQWPNDTV